MRTALRIFSIALGSLLLFGGTACRKNEAAAGQPKPLEQSVVELRTALASANPEVQKNLSHGVSFNIRYGDYAKASLALQQIAIDSSLTGQQKQAVNKVSDLLKQALESQQNTGQPPH